MRLLIVGEAPGKTEMETGIPFTGKSGQWLRRVLISHGFNLDECEFINIFSAPLRVENRNIPPTLLQLYRARDQWDEKQAEQYYDVPKLLLGRSAQFVVPHRNASYRTWLAQHPSHVMRFMSSTYVEFSDVLVEVTKHLWPR